VLLVSQRKEIEVISSLPTMMGNKKILLSQPEEIFQNIAVNSLNSTEVNTMNMEMDKQGRNMR
jgi:hypothetical protein